MIALNLPQYDFKFKTEGQRTQIFDNIRKKYVALTPEEWVRQHFIAFLVNEKHFPASLLAVEMGLKYNKMNKRSDIVAFAKDGKPVLIVECKAPEVNISQDTFDQAARYNMTLKVKYLVVTNGLKHFCCIIDHEKQSYSYLKDIPVYTDL